MALSPEKISELKQLIHSQMSQNDVQKTIKDTVSFIMRSETAAKTSPSACVCVKSQSVDSKTTGIAQEAAHVNPNRRYLRFQILAGRAFLDHLNPDPSGKSTFRIHLHFRRQRFMSQPFACTCDPPVRETFLIELHKEESGEGSRMLDSSQLLSLCDNIHIVLIRADSSGEASLVSSTFFDWRQVLTVQDGSWRSSVELLGTGKECKVPVGLLDVTIELVPRLFTHITDEVLTTQLLMERTRQAERERLFIAYAKQWWKEFQQIRPHHGDRLVKIFAQDENTTSRPVCSYVRPLRCGRLLDTPRQAARFVSLIRQEKVATVGGGERSEQWTSMHGCLCSNKGDVEDHAVLLCSLLLGFGLNAYVSIGTKTTGAATAWVTTISTDNNVIFWDALNTNRYVHQPINPNDPPLAKQNRPKYPYKTLGCLFNHESFYANCQPLDAVDVCQFDLENGSLWKPMSQEAIHSVCGDGMSPLWPSFPPLCPNSLDSSALSNDLERQLRVLVTNERADNDLTTTWDDELSYLLTQCLSAYEMSRVTGASCGNEEFQDAMRNCVPAGHTFKGYPILVCHRNARRALNSCLRVPTCHEIIHCRGDQVRLAIRVRVFTYPESAIATWIMFACKYKSVL